MKWFLYYTLGLLCTGFSWSKFIIAYCDAYTNITLPLVVSLTAYEIPAQSPTSGPKQEPLEIPKPEELAEAGGQQPVAAAAPARGA